MSQSVVLCEGYLDRAFWAGWLEHLGCTDPSKPTDCNADRRLVLDPGGKQVRGGHFAYHSKSGKFVRVVPCHGKPNVWGKARISLDERHMDPGLERLVINCDADVSAQSELEGSSGTTTDDLLEWVRKKYSSAALNKDQDVELDQGATKVCLVRWEASDEDAPGLPKKQTLERVVCAAIIAVYPERAAAVQSWLESRREAPAAGPKEHAWSYMAGWYAGNGCEYFYRAVWDDPKVAVELESRLVASGAWRIAEALAD